MMDVRPPRRLCMKTSCISTGSGSLSRQKLTHLSKGISESAAVTASTQHACTRRQHQIARLKFLIRCKRMASPHVFRCNIAWSEATVWTTVCWEERGCQWFQSFGGVLPFCFPSQCVLEKQTRNLQHVPFDNGHGQGRVVATREDQVLCQPRISTELRRHGSWQNAQCTPWLHRPTRTGAHTSRRSCTATHVATSTVFAIRLEQCGDALQKNTQQPRAAPRLSKGHANPTPASVEQYTVPPARAPNLHAEGRA